MIYTRFRRWATLILVAGVVAAGVAACGSSSSTSTSSAAAAAPAGTPGPGGSPAGLNRSKLVTCLKAHGVTLPAPPRRARPPSGGYGGQPGFFGGGGAGAARARFANNPKLRAAFQACGGGRGFGGPRRGLTHAAVTRFAACVRQHGYNLPAPNFSGKGPIFPANIAHNAKFQTAARACQADLRPAGAPAPGAPPGSTSATTSGA